jgi:oligopeptidase B
VIDNAYGALTFSPDSAWLYWVWRDENARPSKVFRRPSRGGDDALIYEEPDEGMFIGVDVTADRSHILIQSQNQETSEVWLIPAGDPTAAPVVAEPRREGVRYSLGRWDGRWTVRTNAGDAVDFQLMTSDAAIPARGTWREFIGHRAGRLIAGTASFAGHLVRLERENAIDSIVVRNLAGEEHAIAFDEPAYALNLAAARYDTASPVSSTGRRRRHGVARLDMATRADLRKVGMPTGHDPALRGSPPLGRGA